MAHPHPATVIVPGKENVRGAGHEAHALAPAVLEYVPPGHRTHALAFVAPTSPENVPVMHAVQGPPFGPMYPASQTQLLSNPLEAGAREFTGHRLQFALPSGDH